MGRVRFLPGTTQYLSFNSYSELPSWEISYLTQSFQGFFFFFLNYRHITWIWRKWMHHYVFMISVYFCRLDSPKYCSCNIQKLKFQSVTREKGGTWFELIPLNERGFDFAILPGRFRFCLHSTGAFFCGKKDTGTRLLVGKIRRTRGGR